MKNFLSAVILVSLLMACSAKAQNKQISEQERYKLAADYSKQFRGLSVLIIKSGKVVYEDYQNGYSTDDSHALASGTKSFSGVLLAAAIEDKLVKNFDEKISDTITGWKTDKRKSQITLRQLLSLTSGIDAGQIGRVPSYSEAIDYPSKFDTGTTFQYGPVPFQIFGEVMKRKLAPKKESVSDYLKRRILTPIGLNVASWRTVDGDILMPQGASLSARDWSKFGTFLKDGGKSNGKQIVGKKLLDELFVGSQTNPNYGITFWLNRSNNDSANVFEPKSERGGRLREMLGVNESETTAISKNGFGKNLPKDTFAAAGAGKQRLYIIPSLDLVIVRQGEQSRFDDEEFLQRLISGKVSN